MNVVPGQQCTYTFSSPAVPIVFNPTLLTTQNIAEQCPEVTQLKQDHTSVQSRGTSPMLPASDSCPEDTEENKSDDNGEEILEVCDIENKHESIVFKGDSIDEIRPDKISVNDIKEESIDKNDNVTNSFCSQSTVLDCSEQKDNDIVVKKLNSIETKTERIQVIENTLHKTETDTQNITLNKSQKSSRNIFTDLTEYNPFMDPQVLQAADGLELLSALAEKSAMRINDKIVESKESSVVETVNDIGADIGAILENDVIADDRSDGKKNTQQNPDKRKLNDVKLEEKLVMQKPRVKCGFAFKPKKEKKKSVVSVTKKMTSFCGISIPEG